MANTGQDGSAPAGQFHLNGLNFLLSTSDFTRTTQGDDVVLLKPPEWIEFYRELLAGGQVSRVLELGVFQGGMAFLLPSLVADLDYVGVEWLPELPGVVEALQRRPDISRRVHLILGVSQDDPKLPELVRGHFGGKAPDLIIDDASHRYGFTRRSFQMFFPMLREGGVYVIEDWGWAHWRGFEPHASWRGEESLSNLLFELCMVTASDPGLISSIEVNHGKFTVTRGNEPIPPGWTVNQSVNINGQTYSPIMIPPPTADA